MLFHVTRKIARGETRLWLKRGKNGAAVAKRPQMRPADIAGGVEPSTCGFGAEAESPFPGAFGIAWSLTDDCHL